MNRGFFYNYTISPLCIAVLLIAGCGQSDPPAFRLNMVQMVSEQTPTPPGYQQEIANVLRALFGTPDNPFVLPETGLDLGRLQMAAGNAWSDEQGSNYGLYRRHCVHCHGITGDGRGPTARFLNPYPRDYRPAIYKFKSTYNPQRPTDEDLHRVLINGVPGTAMPSFSLLPSSEVEALVEYVKYLSMRGQLETELIRFVYDELGEEEAEDEEGEPILDEEGEPAMRRIPLDPTNDPDQREVVMDILSGIVEGWDEAEDFVVAPDEESIPADNRSAEDVAASVTKGRELFYGTKANCIKCHGPTALGDGQQDDFNVWNKAHEQFLNSVASMPESLAEQADRLTKRIKEIQQQVDEGAIGEKEAAAQEEELRARLAEQKRLLATREEVADTIYPVRNAIPRNLRQGVYRGGRRRLDIFWRIFAGIAGTPMPATGPASPGAQGTLTEAEMWNIVDYVLSLPYEPPSRPLEKLEVSTDEIP